MTQLTKALMDGGSGLNLMYLNTFEGLGLTQDQLQRSSHSFYGVVLGKQSIPLGWVTLLITFGNMSNYCTKMLTFEVLNFSGPCHVILGRPCYAKFKAIPSYAYLKIKILGPRGLLPWRPRLSSCWTVNRTTLSWSPLFTVTVAVAELRELSL
jgi:hypothetical protein